MQPAIQYFTLAFMVEALAETIKSIIQARFAYNVLVPVALGVLIAVLSGVDLLALAGLPLAVPYVGSILTGILCSRGANFAHDLAERLRTGG